VGSQRLTNGFVENIAHNKRVTDVNTSTVALPVVEDFEKGTQCLGI
jgi:hypothetical protein